ncbi:MAG TPA: phenylalanine 4-monooxygenase [Thermoanaerobaculia bacterium]
MNTIAPILDEFGTRQEWSSYSDGEHTTWGLLWELRMRDLPLQASHAWLRGADSIGLSADQLPDLAQMNRRLAALTGWEAVAVTGYLPADAFFTMLAQRRFPTTIGIRPMSRLDYTPEPDIFHDVFGHVPLHADCLFADFLQAFGARASQATTETERERLTRLFWFTVEFGLVREAGAMRVYGSGLISSSADAANALGEACVRRPFDLDAILAQPFRIDELQPVLYFVDDFSQLFEALSRLPGR